MASAPFSVHPFTGKFCGSACVHVIFVTFCVVGEAGSASEPALVDKQGSSCRSYACNVLSLFFSVH